jgi:hypothetical protein
VVKLHPQTKDIVDMAVHPVVCQKSDFHGNSDFQNSQKLEPQQVPAKDSGMIILAFQSARNCFMVHYKSLVGPCIFSTSQV